MREALCEPLKFIAWKVLEKPRQLQQLVPSFQNLAWELAEYAPAMVDDVRKIEDPDLRLKTHLTALKNKVQNTSNEEWIRAAFELAPNGPLLLEIFKHLLTRSFTSGFVSEETKGIIMTLAARMSEEEQVGAARTVLKLMTGLDLEKMSEEQKEVILIFNEAIIRQLVTYHDCPETSATQRALPQWAWQAATLALFELRTWRERTDRHFAHHFAISQICSEISSNFIKTDADVVEVSQCLPHIKQLLGGQVIMILRIQRSHSLTDKSLQNLASSMPPDLTGLYLKFAGNKNFTANSVANLKKHLPKNLKESYAYSWPRDDENTTGKELCAYLYDSKLDPFGHFLLMMAQGRMHSQRFDIGR